MLESVTLLILTREIVVDFTIDFAFKELEFNDCIRMLSADR
jgi:hypothetical protein